MISIIGGKFKKKKIEVPHNKVRPTNSIKKEAIFSILESHALKNSYNLYENKCFIDLFAGSGSLGLEAISRGGKLTYFFEKNNEVFKILLKNCNSLCIEKEFKVYKKDINLLKEIIITCPLSVIFIDPPYDYENFESLLKQIINFDILEKNSLIVIETKNDSLIKIPDQLRKIKEKTYGKTKIIFVKKLR